MHAAAMVVIGSVVCVTVVVGFVDEELVVTAAVL
jgi:hypothetical protein